jgi:mannose/cellobiose epimerase-like protein (N-acyl-D-glucosamine 2-epimerase family)
MAAASVGAAGWLGGAARPGQVSEGAAASRPTPFVNHAPLPTDEFSQHPFTPAELASIKRQYEHDLFEDFLPFMDQFVIDHEYGGFMCTADRDGKRISTDKSEWYEGRGIWVYSFLYNNFGRNPKHLEVARKSVEFVLKNKPAGDALWPSAFSREGKPTAGPDSHTYGDLFVAAGLAEFAKAAGEEAHFLLAKETALKCLRVYDRPDFWPESAQSYLGKEAPLTPGARVQGVWFVQMNTATGMLEQHRDPEVLTVSDRCLEAIMNHHYHPDFGLNNEIINHDLSRRTDDIAQFVYTGHAIETLWMVILEAYRRKDRDLFELAARRFKRHVEVAWDNVYGGVFRSLNHVDKNLWLVDKVLWAQEEVLIGSLFVAEHTGWKWARDWFIKAYNYVHDKYPLQKHGRALWDIGTDRKVTYVEHSNRIENYHHPRHLMLNLLAAERMIARGGRPSGFLS